MRIDVNKEIEIATEEWLDDAQVAYSKATVKKVLERLLQYVMVETYPPLLDDAFEDGMFDKLEEFERFQV